MSNSENPFSIGIAKAGSFCNRTKELEDLERVAKNGQKLVLISPRRYGKSSLVLKVLEKLKHEGYKTVYIDFFPISSEADFVSKLANSIIKELGRGVEPHTFTEKLAKVFKKVIPRIELEQSGVSFSFKLDNNVKDNVILEDILEGLYLYVKKNKEKICLAFDEFQEIVELPESKKIEGILRSNIQKHDNVSYFFIGSRRRVLRDMFADKNRPFYKSALFYELQEIPEDEFSKYISERFKHTGKECSVSLAEKIYALVRGYPYYVQKLALFCWDLTEKVFTEDLLDNAYKLLLKNEAPGFEGIWSGLSISQKNLLKAFSNEPTDKPFAKDYLNKYKISAGGVQKAIKALLDKDIIEKREDGYYRLTDPIMGRWF